MNDYSKENFLSILSYFSFTEKGKGKVIDDHGVDLNSKDAANQLKEKGLSSNEFYNFLPKKT
jgi:hypothetical protein